MDWNLNIRFVFYFLHILPNVSILIYIFAYLEIVQIVFLDYETKEHISILMIYYVSGQNNALTNYNLSW